MSGDRLLLLEEVAARYGMTPRTARAHIKAHNKRLPAPCQERPFKWRESDITAHMRRLNIPDQRRQRMAAARLHASDEVDGVRPTDVEALHADGGSR